MPESYDMLVTTGRELDVAIFNLHLDRPPGFLQGVEHRVGEDNDDDKILVQRRSMLKDYCPGKLDPTPGGVVGFGESYEENATREIEEEMGIDLSEENPYRNRMNRLFQFSFEDDRVKVWGEFWEATYNGPIEKLTLQTEEVAEILSIPVKELQALLEKSPDKFLPDSRHAIQLYFERSAGERQ